MRLALDPIRMIPGPFAPQLRLVFSDLHAFLTPPRNLALIPRIRPETEPGDHPGFSRYRGNRARFTIDPIRLITGPFSPYAARFRRLSYISDDPRYNLALSGRMFPVAESDGIRCFSGFPEGHTWLTSDTSRRILGRSPHLRLDFADFSECMTSPV